MSDRATTGDDVVWLTYAELAERTGVELASAQRRAMRAKWRRRPGNDGRARVAVPLAALEVARKEKAPDPSPGATQDTSPLLDFLKARLEAAEAALEGKALKIAQELAEVREDRARLQGELEGVKLATEHLHEAAAQARREAAAARQEAEEAQRRTAQLVAQAAEAQGKLEAAEEVLGRLKGRGLVARLLNRGA